MLRKAGLIGLLSALFFSLGLIDQPFVDEYAYITQSYQPDLLLAGKWNDPYWLEVLGYDLVPLPKYFINFAYRAAGIPRPQRREAMAWYPNTHHRWGAGRELLTARLPSVAMGALGCVAIFALGTLIKDETTGCIAAVLLAVNPLYRLHAHRAMSEPYCEALLLVALALALRAMTREPGRRSRLAIVPLLIAAGCAAGLSILAKFSGFLALFVMTAWTALGVLLRSVDAPRKLMMVLGTGFAVMAAAGLFVVLNPVMTARPTGWLPPDLRSIADLPVAGRFRLLVQHRAEVSRDQQERFAHNALYTPSDRLMVVAIQGFGRFGPLGPAKSNSEIRYDFQQDWGFMLWFALVGIGLVESVRLGNRQDQARRFPTGWALTIWATVALAVVVSYLPMAWDRYLLPIQSPAALLAALPLADGLAAVRSRITQRRARP
jgi:4-amino-4-deoxy-L-arabinose transferase-like glycosyltransferase